MNRRRSKRRPPTISGLLLRMLRKSTLSDSELARQSSVAQSTISRFRRGQRAISVETADKLLSVLGPPSRQDLRELGVESASPAARDNTVARNLIATIRREAESFPRRMDPRVVLPCLDELERLLR